MLNLVILLFYALHKKLSCALGWNIVIYLIIYSVVYWVEYTLCIQQGGSMIKDNQKYFNRLHVIIDALVILGRIL